LAVNVHFKVVTLERLSSSQNKNGVYRKQVAKKLDSFFAEFLPKNMFCNMFFEVIERLKQ